MSDIFLPWNYEAELMLVNERSQQGMHLVKRGLFSRKEVRDPAKTYRYLLDCRDAKGFTALLYKKQGWETVCRNGAWLYFRKEYREGTPETAYELHRTDGRSGIEDHLRSVIRTLDGIRNVLLVLSFIVLLALGFFDTQLIRLVAIPLLACAPMVMVSGKLRKVLGEQNASR